MSKEISKEEAKELEQGEYNLLDDNWWKKAMVIGSDMQPLNV
jgi:hypothetical protein